MKSMLRILIVVNLFSLVGCYGTGPIKPIARIGTWTYGYDYRSFHGEEWFYVGTRPSAIKGEHDAVMCFIFLVTPPRYELVLLEAEPTLPKGRMPAVIDVRFGTGPMTPWYVEEAKETTGVAIKNSRQFMVKAMKSGTIGVRYLYKGKPVVCTFQMDGFKELEEKYFPSLDGWSFIR